MLELEHIHRHLFFGSASALFLQALAMYLRPGIRGMAVALQRVSGSMNATNRIANL